MNKDKHGKDKPEIGTAIIIRKDNKVLFGKRLKEGRGKNTWHFPGGRIEAMESIEACAAREAKEETNVDVENIKIVGVTSDIYEDDRAHYVTIWLVANYVGGEVKDMEPDLARDWDWYEWGKLPKPFVYPLENFMKQNYDPFEDEVK